jgi:hypothetical protein
VAVGSYYVQPAGHRPSLHVLQLLTFDADGRIRAITAFVGTELQPFGLPEAPPS